MTVSTHVYSARVMPANRPLGPVEGRVRLDASGIPHVTGDVSFSMKDAAQLALLDPRASARLEVTAARDGGAPRRFDLGIRDVVPNRGAGTVKVSLASDEAILDDVKPLADDHTPRTHEASLRAVCSYVLGKIGAVLQPGTTDADFTAWWDLTQMIPNPVAAVNADTWGIGQNATQPGRIVMQAPLPPAGPGSAITWNAGAAGVSNIVSGTTASYRVQPGRTYVFSFWIATGGTARTVQALLQWRNWGGAGTMATVWGAPVVSDASQFRRVHVIATAPAGAEYVWPIIHTQNNSAGQAHYVAGAMLHEGDRLQKYYDGATPDDEHYLHDWADPAKPHASASIRKATPIERSPESLIWRAGVGGLEFLAPALKTAGLRLVCDELRRWTLRNDEYRATGEQMWRYAVNITAADEKLSRDDEAWFDAAVYVYSWTDDAGMQHTRIDAFSLTPNPTKVARFEVNSPYPGPGRAEHMVRRAQGKGRTVTVTGIPAWTEQTDQPLQVLLDGTPIQLGITSSVEFSLDDDTVTVSSRTTDTPGGAIDLRPGTINALPGTINNL